MSPCYRCLCSRVDITTPSITNDLFSVECSAGFYGEQCKSNCGHCVNQTTCHYFTGACENECEPGYMSPNCTEGIFLECKYSI